MNLSARLLSTTAIAAGLLAVGLAGPATAAPAAGDPASAGGFQLGEIDIASCRPAPNLGKIGVECMVSSSDGTSKNGREEAEAVDDGEDA